MASVFKGSERRRKRHAATLRRDTLPRPRQPEAPESALELERVHDPADIAEEWDALALASRNVFATRTFLSLWLEHHGDGRELLLRVCREPVSGRAVGILPLYRWRRFPLSVVRFLGHGAGDELGPICAPEDASRVARALQQALAEDAPRLFVGERLPADPGLSLSGARTVVREGSPTIFLSHSDFDDYLASRSSNFRQQLRRGERKLARDHSLRYRPLTRESFDDDFELLVSLHADRWRQRSSFLRDLDFHRRFARLAADRGWLRLWILELDGAAAAAWYGFSFAGVKSYYQAGRDRNWDGASVGMILLAHTVREALAEGLDEYRLLRGAESYKYRFTDDDEGLATVVVSRGLLAGGAMRAAELARTLRRAAARTVPIGPAAAEPRT